MTPRLFTLDEGGRDVPLVSVPDGHAITFKTRSGRAMTYLANGDFVVCPNGMVDLIVRPAGPDEIHDDPNMTNTP